MARTQPVDVRDHPGPKIVYQKSFDDGSLSQVDEQSSDKENASPNPRSENVSPNPRSILKKEQQASKKKPRYVQFAPDTLISKRELKEAEMENRVLASLQSLVLLWAKHAVQSAKDHSAYKNRLITNFQPGITPRYLKYLICAYTNLGEPRDATLRRDQQSIKQFVKEFNERRDRVEIVDKNSNMKDLTNPDAKLDELLREQIDGKQNCIIVLSNPICGFNQRAIEKMYNAKVRHVWFPRLDPDMPLISNKEYKYSTSSIKDSYGIPAILELDIRDRDECIRETTRRMPLWTKPEFKPYLGHFFTLFGLFRAKAQVHTTTMLSAEMSVLDAATILGFDVVQSSALRKGSDGEEKKTQVDELKASVSTPLRGLNTSKSLPLWQNKVPYSLTIIEVLSNKFAVDNPDFDAFKLIRGNSLKWFEAERAVARALTDGTKSGSRFGDTWPFFSTSSLRNSKHTLQLQPQVIPKVCKNGSDLDEDALEAWRSGIRLTPPQSTMKPSGWAKLIPCLAHNRAVIPMETSKSPDVMFVLGKSAPECLLCLQVKTGAQDPDLSKLVLEIAKCPFLALDSSMTKIVRTTDSPAVPIVFVYVASVHAKIKDKLLTEAVVVDNGAQTQGDQNTASVVKYFEYIQVTAGSKVLPLPDRVEVIVLLKAGLASLFGNDYDALLDPLCEIRSFAEEETRENLRNKSESLPNTEEEVRAAARALFNSVKHVPGADKFLINEIFQLVKG